MFFGWYIVIATLVLLVFHGGIIGYGFTAFIGPIAATFGWSYAQIALGLSFRGLEVGLLDPFVGIAVDRWPARRLVLLGVIAYGLGLLILSQTTNLFMFYAGFLIVGLGHSFCLHVVPVTVVARWFKKGLGKASAVLALGGGIGGVLVPAMVRMIDAYGWQTSLLILAISFLTLGIPLSFVYRSRPEDHGLFPDGKSKEDVKGHGGSASFDADVGVRQALKMRAFWHINIAYMLQMGSIHAVVIHVMPYLDSLGVERTTAGIIAMLIPLVSLTARLPFGWLADIYRKTNVMAVSMGLTSVGLILFWMLDGSSLGWMIAFVVVFGLGLGGPAPIRAPLVREYFGIGNFGTIYGLLGLSNMLGQLVYPPLAGWVYDTLGYYKPIWLIFAAGSMLGTVLMFATPPPRSKAVVSQAPY